MSALGFDDFNYERGNKRLKINAVPLPKHSCFNGSFRHENIVKIYYDILKLSVKLCTRYDKYFIDKQYTAIVHFSQRLLFYKFTSTLSSPEKTIRPC